MERRRDRLASRANILFDLDGTLVESSGAHARAFAEALGVLAPHLAPGFDYEELKGRSTEEAFAHLGVRDPDLLIALTREKQQRYRRAVADGRVALCEGAAALLEALAMAGKRLFVVSGSSAASVRLILDRAGIRHYFEGVIDAGMVGRSKPAPDPYLLCLARHDLRPESSLAVEDAETGLASAQAAGLDVVVIHNPELARRYGPAFATLPALLDYLCLERAIR